MSAPSIYNRLGVRPFINARGTITTLGGSIMPAPVVAAMVEASQHFVALNQLQEKAGEYIASLTGAEAAFICAGAASGMMLAGAACLTGEDRTVVENLPDIGDRPNEFIISLVDSHTYIHQGFKVCGGSLAKAGTHSQVSADDYAKSIAKNTAALVFFLGSQPKDQLPEIIALAHRHELPVIVDAAAQLPPRSNLTDLTSMGADLVVFSGGKGLFGPQSSGLILGRRDLIRACALNSNPHSAIGRGMKVGKEEIAGLVKAVELFMEQDEEALIQEWEKRCQLIATAVQNVAGIQPMYQPPYTSQFPPASPMLTIHFDASAPLEATAVARALEEGEPAILVSASTDALTIGPQTLQEGEERIIARRLGEILASP